MARLEGDIIGLDLGMARTGVARISTLAKLAEPLKSIDMKADFIANLQSVIESNNAVAVVAGVPRSLDGIGTDQTKWAESEVQNLKENLRIPVFAIDEAGTTKKAEELASSMRDDIDSISACIIAGDFVAELERGRIDGYSI
ncbi:pre-16S rRNA-processing nuclease YqgF [Candidatus Saccharibacteria bacterium]|nr:pre-16S rRNA-processing nuclease YqgF [Candidatus Saccharibacteria bacterium]